MAMSKIVAMIAYSALFSVLSNSYTMLFFHPYEKIADEL